MHKPYRCLVPERTYVFHLPSLPGGQRAARLLLLSTSPGCRPRYRYRVDQDTNGVYWQLVFHSGAYGRYPYDAHLQHYLDAAGAPTSQDGRWGPPSWAHRRGGPRQHAGSPPQATRNRVGGTETSTLSPSSQS